MQQHAGAGSLTGKKRTEEVNEADLWSAKSAHARG